MAQYSNIEVGGYFNDEGELIDLVNCTFSANGTAIYSSGDNGAVYPSVVHENIISGNDLEGIFSTNSLLTIRNNTIEENGRNGVWGYKGRFSQISGNDITDNGGCEFVGTVGSYDQFAGGWNTITDAQYEPGIDPPEKPMFNSLYMDRFLLYLSQSWFVPVDVYNNYIDTSDEERFYYDISCFNFGDGDDSEAEEACEAGVNNFDSGEFYDARVNFEGVFAVYPDTKYAVTSL